MNFKRICNSSGNARSFSERQAVDMLHDNERFQQTYWRNCLQNIGLAEKAVHGKIRKADINILEML